VVNIKKYFFAFTSNLNNKTVFYMSQMLQVSTEHFCSQKLINENISNCS